MHAPAGTQSRCPWICPIIRNMNIYIYIWLRGGDLNGFWGIRPIMKWKGEACSQEDPQSRLLDAFFHKEHKYM